MVLTFDSQIKYIGVVTRSKCHHSVLGYGALLANLG